MVLINLFVTLCTSANRISGQNHTISLIKYRFNIQGIIDIGIVNFGKKMKGMHMLVPLLQNYQISMQF